jgi:carbonic anhydrase
MSDNIQELLDGNIAWVEEIRAKEPRFFEELSQGQSPKYLWIGCSDSRVPPTQITKSQPGSIFVQRNIANLVVHTDANLLSVVYYAVKYLKVEHVVVCGHYGCGGVMAAMDTQSYGS